jgi:hypothetical protein
VPDMNRSHFLRWQLGLVLCLVLGPAILSGAQNPPAAPERAPRALLEPANPGWERFFELTWRDADQSGSPRLRGRIVNRYGHAASNIKLLVDGLDADARIVHQQVEWLGTDLGPFGSAPFDIRMPRRFAQIRIRVFAFDWTSTDM